MVDYFSYPIDSQMLLRRKNIIKKQLLEQQKDWIKKRIALLGGSTTNEVADQMQIFLLHYGIKAEFYQSAYGQYWQDAVFGTPELENFMPDIIYIHTSWRNIQAFPEVSSAKEQVDILLSDEVFRFKSMWEALAHKFHCPLIQNNFERPDYRLMGNRDIWDYRGRSNFICRLNQAIYDYAQNHEDFYVNDLEYIAQDYGVTKWNNSLYWHMYGYAMCMDAIPYVAQSVANIIKSIYGKNRKLLALDLDHTLWGGIIGDDGAEGIELGAAVPKGQIYAEFQRYCKKLKDIGVMLAVNSKNEMENALSGLNHPNGALRLKDFVAVKANWNPKDQNLREIADELAMGIDSFVFADDNPAEREIVAAQLPDVAVPVLNRVEKYIEIMDHSGFFEATVLSQEDLKKTELYHARAEASTAATAFADYGEYLDSLQMTVFIDDFKPAYIQRIAQLTNKSNQFNLTTLRCTEDDIKKMQEDENNICLCGRLTDKFYDNGLVTVVVGSVIGDEVHVRLWLTSCRVLKRGLEEVLMNVLVEEAKKRKNSKIIGYYYPTAKNSMVKDFYGDMGYTKKYEDASGNIEWELDLSRYTRKRLHMKVDNLKK